MMSPFKNFLVLDRAGLDRLLNQRSAPPMTGIPLDLPPQRGGTGSFSVGAVGLATKSRALSALSS
jgi:hypothetical protein